jgi:hypothetical protein
VAVGSNFLLPGYAVSVPVAKISIAIEKEQLRLARTAAKAQGLSLSAYVTRAVSSQLENQGRMDAARRLHASWGPESMPTPKERERFLARMGRRTRREKAA